jgi:RNase P subunit RPR2
MDLATLKEHAARARRLAKHADPFTQRRLLDLAREYEAQIETIQQRTQKSQ